MFQRPNILAAPVPSTSSHDDQTGDDKPSSSKADNTVDASSLYYLHASDTPSQSFVDEPLHDGNYGDWVIDMSDALFAKNKFGFVDGTLPMPSSDSPNFLLWQRCNAMVKGWLNHSMSKELRHSVRHAATASAIWSDLKERFGKESAPRVYELKRAVTHMRQDLMSVSAYYTKLKALWDGIESVSTMPKCTCGRCNCNVQKQLTDLREKERLYEFLMGLDESFSVVRTQILSTRPTPNLSTAYHLIAEEEEHKKIAAAHHPSVEAAAFKAAASTSNLPLTSVDNPQSRRFSTDSGAQKDSRNDETRPYRRERPHCDYCHRIGHSMDYCYQKFGYPQGRGRGAREMTRKDGAVTPKQSPRIAHVDSGGESPIPGINLEQYYRMVDFFSGKGQPQVTTETSPVPAAHMAGKSNFTWSWIIDSGSTEHVTCDETMLQFEKSGDAPSSVMIPNGTMVPFNKAGSVQLTKGLKLSNVLNIPAFKCNLLSVSRLTKEHNCALTFFPDCCAIQDLPSRTLIGAGRECNGLYYLEPIVEKSVAMTVKVDPVLWHKRLGHASRGKLQSLQHIDKFDLQFCDSCLRAKQTRLPFPLSSISTSSCFEMLYCDIWGNYKVASLSGAFYFLSVVDDYSRGVWVFLMKNKSEVGYHLMNFCRMVNTQFGRKVKRIRADNGVEFKTKPLLEFYHLNGIMLETSCTDTSQQNGVVERKHIHLLEIARALRFEAGLPIYFWGECVLTVTYIINRLPSKVIKNRTPYEVLFGKKPSYDHMRVFGSLVYAKDNKKGLNKFGARGRRCIFVGYPHMLPFESAKEEAGRQYSISY